jgi:hypothetical protein
VHQFAVRFSLQGDKLFLCFCIQVSKKRRRQDDAGTPFAVTVIPLDKVRAVKAKVN